MDFQPLADNLWMKRFPLTTGGMAIGRNVSLIRLESGKLIIHSSAPFSPENISAIDDVGTPTWLVDATNFHDTHCQDGAEAFPDIPYLVPDGFKASKSVETRPLLPSPDEWEQEVEVIPVEGMPKINEHVFYLRKSKALVLCDLVFHLTEDFDSRTRGIFRFFSGSKSPLANTRLFRFFIRDSKAFGKSIQKILSLDFEILVMGHGEPILEGGQQKLQAVFRENGYDV